jgi:RNA polymerase sigma factor (sigma-70 family)
MNAVESIAMEVSTGDARLGADVLLATEGSREAFGRLIDATRNVVTSISLAIVRDVALSEDVAQEAYLEAWRTLRRLRNPASFVPWLRQLTRNRAHDQLRRRSRARITELDGEFQDPGPDARSQLIAAEERTALAAALDELPASAREVVTLFYREGQSISQVAQLLGMSDAAVKKRLERARACLREATLKRLGEIVSKSAPAAGFTAAVLGALTTGAPTTASAAVLVKAAPLVAKTALGAVLAGVFAGALGGALGVLAGVRKEWCRARDDEERRELRRFAVVNMLIAAVGAALMPLGHWLWPGGIGLALGFLAFWAPMMRNYLFWLPSITARREALERNEDPKAARRQRRERMLSRLGLFSGSLVGGGTVVYIILELHHLI